MCHVSIKMVANFDFDFSFINPDRSNVYTYIGYYSWYIMNIHKKHANIHIVLPRNAISGKEVVFCFEIACEH